MLTTDALSPAHQHPFHILDGLLGQTYRLAIRNQSPNSHCLSVLWCWVEVYSNFA
jgi:hypothetical protein